MTEPMRMAKARRVGALLGGLSLLVCAIDLVAVLFFGGVNFAFGPVTLRSTTLEFPVIAILCSLLFLLLALGKTTELCLLVASLGVAGVMAELILRAVDHPLSKPHVDYVRWYEPADMLGHKLAAGFDGFGPLSVRVKTNSHGFRDDEHSWEKREGRLRVLGLGDSFTFGWGVKAEESYLRQLEEELGGRTGVEVETINAGVPGWHLNHYYVYLKKLGLRYDPDVIVIGYFLDDLNASVLETIPAEESYRQGVQFKGGWLHHSRLYNFAKSIADRVRHENRYKRIPYLHALDERRAEWAARRAHLMTEAGGQDDERYVAVLQEQLARLQKLAEAAGAVLIVMYIPDLVQLHHPEAQHINRVLSTLTNRIGIPFVDMTPVFEEAENLDTYYLWPRDAHTNARGHRAMAGALATLLCESETKVILACHASREAPAPLRAAR